MPKPLDDAYICLTPFGVVVAEFPEDDPGVDLHGNDDAVAFVRRAIESSTNIDGISLTTDAIEPDDLVSFCRVDGLTVIEPPRLDTGKIEGEGAAAPDSMSGQEGAPSV